MQPTKDRKQTLFFFLAGNAASFLLTTLFALSVFLVKEAKCTTKNFPLYTAILPNVSFWEKIYEKYPNDTIIVHDKDDIQKIYAIIHLPPPKNEHKRQENQRIAKKIQKKYTNILLGLRRHPAKSATEKRVAAFFTGTERNKQLTKAARQVRIQNGQQQRFRQSVIRSGAYLAIFKKIFRSYNLPEELAYLPHVESSFHPGAYSKVGACGIWQFTKSTGERYLIIDDAVDERLDPIVATHAAAKYFSRSYSHIKHWPLTLTSYNYGIAGTIRAKKTFGSYTGVFRNHRTPTFGFASRNFYSEFIAAKKVAQRLEKKLPLQKPEKIYSMKLTGYLEGKDVLNYFHISKKRLKELNPALRPAVFSGRKRITRNYSLHLPQSKTIKEKIANFPKIFYYKNQKSTRLRYHRVQQGENLGSIAMRFNVSVKELQKINMMGSSSLIKTGQKLQIPAYTTKQRWRENILLLKRERSKQRHYPEFLSR